MKTWRGKIVIAMLLLFGLVQVVQGAVDPAKVGVPINPHGFPSFYEDGTGLKLEPGLPPPAGNATLGNGSLVIFDPLRPSTDLEVGAELFWWMADASMPMPGGGQALLVMALEGAFNGTGQPVDGQQMSFGRIRIRVDTPVAGTYTITHPYGQQTFTNVPAGTKGINYTNDVGAINPLFPAEAFLGALNSPMAASFLTWPGYAQNPALQLKDAVSGAVLEQYVGDPNIPHVVTGSPTGKNFFRVQGPNGLDVQTDLFLVMGKVHDPSIASTAHAFPAVPTQKLFASGPVNRVQPFLTPTVGTVTGVDQNYAVGYPLWFQENTGTEQAPAGGVQLTLSPPNDSMGISAPVEPAHPNSVALRVGDESFWWSAGALVDIDANNQARLDMALEAAFSGVGTAAEGNQISFGRIRIRVDAPVAGTYTVTHPYGQIVFPNVPAGVKAINYTNDIGMINPADPDGAFRATLYSDVGPTFLKWTTFNVDPLLTDPLLVKPSAAGPGLSNYYVGDPAIAHQVTGSPTGKNFFRVQGPNGLNAQTDLFNVSGKVYDPQTFVFGAPANQPVAANDTGIVNLSQASSVSVNVLANDTFANPATVTVMPAGPAFGPTGGTATVNGNGTVTYTPNANFSGTDTFGYRLVDSTTLTSNTATVTVTVVPVETLTVQAARLDLRRLLWDVAGTSNSEGATVTVRAGSTGSSPVIGTAVVSAGAWRLRTGTTVANTGVTTVSVVSSTGAVLLAQPLRVR